MKTKSAVGGVVEQNHSLTGELSMIGEAVKKNRNEIAQLSAQEQVLADVL